MTTETAPVETGHDTPLDILRRITAVELELKAIKRTLEAAVEKASDHETRLDNHADEIGDLEDAFKKWQTANHLLWEAVERKLSSNDTKLDAILALMAAK